MFIHELGGIAGAIGAHVDAVEDRIAKEFGADAEYLAPEDFSIAGRHQHRRSTHTAARIEDDLSRRSPTDRRFLEQRTTAFRRG